MKVSSTEVQNNFGKYLLLSLKEDIIITRNGQDIARLSAIHYTAPDYPSHPDVVREQAVNYSYGGKEVSFEEFLELTKDTEGRYEYIDGEIYLQASPKTAHQTAVSELFVIFHNWFKGKKCRPMVAPYDIILQRKDGHMNLVQPDIMVICDLEEKLGKDNYYKGVPSLVVEITSESTRRLDLIKKLDLYAECGVEEYWLVNPQLKDITVYRFKDGEILEYINFHRDDTACSYIFPGLTAEAARVFS